MSWECFCVVGFDLGPLLQGGTRILHLQYFFKYVLTYFLHLNSSLLTFLHNTICRAQLFCPFLLSASKFLSNMLFNCHLPSQIKNTQSADTVPVHGHSPLVYHLKPIFLLLKSCFLSYIDLIPIFTVTKQSFPSCSNLKPIFFLFKLMFKVLKPVLNFSGTHVWQSLHYQDEILNLP